MPRARNIKPSFLTNDELGELEPLARLLFIGMWIIADYKGDFEWRPKKVKAQILPYDDCDVVCLAINLDKSGFIRFYSCNSKIYCRVVNFSAHQNPHKNERIKGSDIPEYDDDSRQAIDFNTITINHDKSGLIRNDSESDRADSLSLNPDSLSLNPKPSLPSASKYTFEESHKRIALNLCCPIQKTFPTQNINIEQWSDAVRKLIQLDKKTENQILALWGWVREHQGSNGFSWNNQIRTPMKLRELDGQGLKYFDKIQAQMRATHEDKNVPSGYSGTQSNKTRDRTVSQGLADTSWSN